MRTFWRTLLLALIASVVYPVEAFFPYGAQHPLYAALSGVVAPPNSPSGATYYWSPAAGASDANDCLAPAFVSGTHGPCLHPDTVSGMTIATPATFLYDTANGPLAANNCITFSWSKISGTAGITVGSYGGGIPQINSSATCAGSPPGDGLGPRTALMQWDGVDNAVFGPMVLRGNHTSTQYGFLVQNTDCHVNHGPMTANNLDVGGFNITLTTDESAEIEVIGFALNGCGQFNNIHDITFNAPVCHGVDGVGSIDERGCNAAFGYNQNILNLKFVNAIAYDLGGVSGGYFPLGLACDGTESSNPGDGKGCYISGVTHDIGWNFNGCGGPSGVLLSGTDNSELAFIEAYNTQSHVHVGGDCDYVGVDVADNYVTNTHAHFIYTHDNYAGILLHPAGTGCSNPIYCPGNTWGNNFIDNWISENEGSVYGDLAPFAMGCYGGCAPNEPWGLSNSTIVAGPNAYSSLEFTPTFPTPGYVINNIVVKQSAAALSIGCNGSSGVPPDVIFRSNIYWTADGSGDFSVYECPGEYATFADWQAVVPGGEIGSSFANPLLVGTIPAGLCSSLPGGAAPTCPAAYKLQAGSPALGAGAYANAPPFQTIWSSVTDYFGTTLPPAANHFNSIGASQMAPTNTESTSPAVAVTVPTAGATLSGNAALTATCTDAGSCQAVQFFANGLPISSYMPVVAGSGSYVWPTTLLTNGSYTLTAKGWNTVGHQTISAGVGVSLSNTPPLVVGNTDHAASFSGTSVSSNPFSTIAPTGKLLVNAFVNANATPTFGVSDTAGLTWTQRAIKAIAGNADFVIVEYAAPFGGGQLSGDVITLSLGAAGCEACNLDTVEVEGSTGFAASPVTGAPDPLSITTSAASCVFGMYRFPVTTGPTAGSGFTATSGANQHLTEYACSGGPQSGFSVTVGNGAGTADAGITDALK